jgi:glycosyltransferase involved in cell wall biosynthesis
MTPFTVIIPTYNRPHFLLAAVQSVQMQKYVNFELLIVNDGDDAIAAFDDPRIRVLNNNGRGAVPARNFGVAEARGTFIAFLDDDDVWTDALHLSKAHEALLTGADFYFADGVMRFPNGEARAFMRDANAATLAHDNTILISTVCYAKTLHNALGHFDEALPYYWDWDWYLRVARAGFIIHRHSQPAVDIRVHAQNMSGDDNLARRRANLDLLRAKHGLGEIAIKNHTDFV